MCFFDVSATTRSEIEERLGSGGSKRTGVRDGEERVSSGGSKRSGVREERISSGGTKRNSSAGSTGRGGKASNGVSTDKMLCLASIMNKQSI